ncbi:hypothetical protein BKA69DRAFT_767118 [Paraphysoderma sedebokerense]|nr:hypothetical protein BKA69DRAFT_767118 [Paraphysoderma sedebokerense]
MGNMQYDMATFIKNYQQVLDWWNWYQTSHHQIRNCHSKLHYSTKNENEDITIQNFATYLTSHTPTLTTDTQQPLQRSQTQAEETYQNLFIQGNRITPSYVPPNVENLSEASADDLRRFLLTVIGIIREEKARLMCCMDRPENNLVEDSEIIEEDECDCDSCREEALLFYEEYLTQRMEMTNTDCMDYVSEGIAVPCGVRI